MLHGMMLGDFKMQNNKSYKQFCFQPNTQKYSINGSNQEQAYYSLVHQAQVKLYLENV